MNSNFHIWMLTPTDVDKTLTTTPQGISEAEANLRLKQSGYNELPEPQTPELGWAIWAVIWVIFFYLALPQSILLSEI